MNDHSDGTRRGQERLRRAKEFAEKLEATGLKMSDFAKEAGFTRNVIYNLSIGQAPSSSDQAAKLAAAFERLKRRSD
jgi:plasmid maintenance system antidote protein VapI